MFIRDASLCHLTFGGMCSWHRVAMVRRAPYRSANWRRGRGVFALVVRCRVMRLLVYSRVCKNCDPPAGGSHLREQGRALASATNLSSLARRFSRYGKARTYTDLLCRRASYHVVIYVSLLHLSHL